MVSLSWRRTAFMVPALAIAAAFLSPAAAQAGRAPGVRPSAQVVPVADLSGRFPESIAIDRQGNMYLGLFLEGAILKISPTGKQSTFATFPAGSEALGVRVGPDGAIYAAVANTDASKSGVWRVSASGRSMRQIGIVPGFPNGLAFDRRGDLFVSESVGGAVYRISRSGGPARLWSDSPLLKGAPGGLSACGEQFGHLPLGANGIGFTRNGDLLANNTTEATIVRIPVLPDGRAGQASLFEQQNCGKLFGADGMITDPWGNIYVAANQAQKIDRISPTGRIQVLASKCEGDPLYTPSDVAFGRGMGERGFLFISNFALAYPGGAGGGVVKLLLGFGRPRR